VARRGDRGVLVRGSFRGRDGAPLAYREIGEGRPLVLLHGYFSTAQVNWVRFGHAQALADRGHRVVMPDLRAHGDSARPRDPAAYPPDVLTDDGLALVEHLDLTNYDLGCYSLGGRITIRMLVRGASPRRAIVAGMGLESIERTGPGDDHFRRILANPGTFERGSPEWMAEAFLQQVGGDPGALVLLLDTSVGTTREELARIETPTLVAVGTDDVAHASAETLAKVLPRGQFVLLPGNHMSAVTKPELAVAIAEFLDGPSGDPTIG
jgi:pimeloyl-ACP methyl ester carboxylesterase